MSLQTYVKRTLIPASAEEVFAWHEAPGAFQRLTPPWEKVRVVHHAGGIKDGADVRLLVGRMPFVLRWDLTHCDYQPGRSFTDRQVKGPFKQWTHVHRMLPRDDKTCLLEDRIEYELPLGLFGALLGRFFMKRKLDRLFEYRHKITLQAFA